MVHTFSLFLFTFSIFKILSADLGTTVFKPGEGGYPCIRIPAIASTPNGDLIALAECRGFKGDGCEPQLYTGIFKDNLQDSTQRWVCQKRSTDNGKTWSNLTFPVGLTYTSMEPTIVYDYIKMKLILQINAYIGQKTQTVLQTISTDNGLTWSTPIDIGHLFLANNTDLIVGPGTGLQLLNNGNSKYYGRILFIGYEGTYKDARVWYSDDFGVTYSLSSTVLIGMDESQLVELSNGSVAANMRNNHLWNCNCRGIAMSNNGGTTFTAPYPEKDLISPVCQASIISLNNGSVILFSNPDSTKSRVNMQVKKSIDNGVTWNSTYNLCPSCGAGYSCLSSVKMNGYFGLLWETNITGCSGESCQSMFSLISTNF
eukprot:374610_1